MPKGTSEGVGNRNNIDRSKYIKQAIEAARKNDSNGASLGGAVGSAAKRAVAKGAKGASGRGAPKARSKPLPKKSMQNAAKRMMARKRMS